MKLRSWLAIVAVSMLISGCASPVPIREVDDVTQFTPGPSAPVETVPVTPPTPALAVNDRGNVPIAFGQSFTLDGATMVINGAVFDPPCTGSDGSPKPPENGHFLVLEVQARTAADTTIDPFNNFGFTWIEASGMTTSGSGYTNASRACFDIVEWFPDLGPSQSGAGKIVIDVTSLGGTLIWREDVRDSGYEWTIVV